MKTLLQASQTTSPELGLWNTIQSDLVSNRIRNGLAKFFAVDARLANLTSQGCTYDMLLT
jgi:hypothetical protein